MIAAGQLLIAHSCASGLRCGAVQHAVCPRRSSSKRLNRKAKTVCMASTSVTQRQGGLLTLTKSKKSAAVVQAERRVLELLSGVKGRGKDGVSEELQADLEASVAVLEADGGVQAPTTSPLLEGRWKLLFTTRPGSASPIQRTFTGVEAFRVFQEIQLQDAGQEARVNNIVEFGSAGMLKVMAEANTDTRPIPGFVPRRGAGLPLFGKSATYPPASPNLRIDFQFDYAYFDFEALPFRVPYPVPFKLLGDETKGWIDVTYLSGDGNLRLSRGNKGTLFILVKDQPPRQQLMQALEAGPSRKADIPALVDNLIEQGPGGGVSPVRAPARSELAQGRWRLRWAAQASNANPLQRAFSDVVLNYQVVGGDAGEGRLDNIVEFAPFLKLRAGAACGAASATRTSVDIDAVEVQLGSLRIPLEGVRQQAGEGYIDWLYLDEDLRVTRGNKGSLFVHTRE